MKLYEQLAQSLGSLRRCESKGVGNVEWFWKHRETIERLAREHLPSGSGFDNGSTLNFDRSTPNRLVFDTAFHHMSDGGFYCGWTEHQVICTPDLALRFDIRVTGRNVRDIKGFIGDTFAHALNSDIPE